MPQSVIISDRAFISMLMETHLRITTETGGVFLGHRDSDTWYVIESIDPGPNSLFTSARFEYDRDYIHHLSNKVKSIYVKPLELIGLWHRHPGSFDSFSSTDDTTNTEYARQSLSGAVSALVNIDPKFRLTMYAVTLPLHYEKIKVDIGSDKIPRELIAYKSSNMMIDVINSERYPPETRKGLGQFFSRKKNQEFNTGYALKSSFSNKLHEFLKKKGNDIDLKISNQPRGMTDTDLDLLLETMQSDFDYFENMGIGCELEKTASGTLLLRETSPNILSPAVLSFFAMRGEFYFAYNGKIYRYQKGFFKKIYQNYTI